MTLATILLRLTDYLNDASTKRWSDTTRTAFVNIAYQEICNADNWPFREALDSSITTVSGTQSYMMPTSVNLPLGIWTDVINAPNKLGIVSRKEREIFNYPTSGKPLYYFLFGGNIQLYPTPDQAYNLQIEYQRRISDLSLSSDEPIFDPNFHYLIPLRAAALLKRTSGGGDVNEAQDLDELFKKGLDDMKFRLLPRDLDRTKQVISRYDNGLYSETFKSFY